jgi:hypothetical protein
MSHVTDDELMARALRAYWTAARKDEKETGASWPIPSQRVGGVEDIGGKRYVVLRDGASNVLAVYRLRNDAVLKRLVRWPAELAVTQGRAAKKPVGRAIGSRGEAAGD